MKKLKKYRYSLWLTIVVILMGMTACGPRETELSFETIERSDYGGYSVQEPRMVLITSREELDQLGGLVSQTALDQLTELDFHQYFAIAVFRGTQSTSGYDTIIKRVARRGDKVVIYAEFHGPGRHKPVEDIVTSPYHLIKVHRDGGVIGETELVLQGRAIISTPPSR